MQVQYSTRAAREIRKLPAQDARRLREAIERLAGSGERAENLDIKVLAGHAPWLRIRVGDWRVIYRPVDPGPGYFVARVINRRDLESAIKQL
jgi:mRNA-degrading endonuclease RelE of RelBE toxin-antitoxin system